MLLDVVACCGAKFETGHTFISLMQTDATLLANNSQNCWELLRPFARSLTLAIRDLTKPRRRRQRERQKSNMFNEKNNNSARALRSFVLFFAVPAQLRRKMTKL